MRKGPLIVIILGRPGSGKGTQVDLLRKELGLDYISSGELLRSRKEKKDFTGREIANVIDRGGLIPTPVIFKLWLDRLEEFKLSKQFKGLAMEGSPRKILEAYLMEETLVWYGWDKNIKIFWIDISAKESISRLLRRNRKDDTLSGIKKRLSWFESEVRPVIKYYQKKRGVIKINGEQDQIKVSQDIFKHLK